MTVVTAALCLLGAILTALGSQFPVMAAGRLLFGLGAETMIVAITVAFAQWFSGRHFALFFALNISVSRLGLVSGRSLALFRPLAATSRAGSRRCGSRWASRRSPWPVRSATGWRIVTRHHAAPLAIAAAVGSHRVGQPAPLPCARTGTRWRCAWPSTRSSFHFAARSRSSISSDAHQLSLEEASTLNSYVFLAAAFATPGVRIPRRSHRAAWAAHGARRADAAAQLRVPRDDGEQPWLPTVLLGIAFSLVPAVLWPAVARYVEPHQLGTAYGLMTMLQNLGLTIANVIAGYINDASGASASNPAATRRCCGSSGC